MPTKKKPALRELPKIPKELPPICVFRKVRRGDNYPDTGGYIKRKPSLRMLKNGHSEIEH
jgi:hypothetical protein